MGSSPGSEREEGMAILQYSCLENPMDGGPGPWGGKESDTIETLSYGHDLARTSRAKLGPSRVDTDAPGPGKNVSNFIPIIT